MDQATSQRVNLTDFIFQKTYAEEMSTCIYVCICSSCEGCYKDTGNHICQTELAVQNLDFWDEAKHYFSINDVIYKMEQRCEKYRVPKYETHDLMIALRKANHEWLEQLQTMVVILDL